MLITSVPSNKSRQPKPYRAEPEEWRKENALNTLATGYEKVEFMAARDDTSCNYQLVCRRANDSLQCNPEHRANKEIDQPVRDKY